MTGLTPTMSRRAELKAKTKSNKNAAATHESADVEPSCDAELLKYVNDEGSSLVELVSRHDELILSNDLYLQIPTIQELEKEFDDLQASRAGAVIQLLTQVREFSAEEFNTPEFDDWQMSYHTNLVASIRKNLDENSIWEFMRQAGKIAISLQNKEKNFKRHAPSRDKKAHVFAWCDKHFQKSGMSMDAAATFLISGSPKQVDCAFRTARAYIGEWKKMRSAGKP